VVALRAMRIVGETTKSFNPKPEAMADSGMDRLRAATTIAFGLDETMDSVKVPPCV